MFLNILKKYWFFILLFLLFLIFAYLNKLNFNNPLPYVNLFLYFFTFLFIGETLSKTVFNKNIVYLFYFFYGYLSIFMSLFMLLRHFSPTLYYVLFLSSDLILRFFLVGIPIYILLYSFKFFNNSSNKTFIISILFSFVIVFLNYYKYVFNPMILNQKSAWADYALKNYYTVVLILIILLIFWIRYYLKKIVVTEYLSSIIFIFTLSNIVEALHFLAYQHNYPIFLYGQIFNFFLNIFMLISWYARLVYLNSDVSKENERYLMNYQYLGELVSKPHQGFLQRMISFIPINYASMVLFVLIIIIFVLYLIQKITFYILLNTVFVLIAVVLALFFSFSSLKRDWQKQVGVFFQKNRRD